MSKIVVISGHPNLSSSNANSAILNKLAGAFNNIDIRHLDKLYPDLKIDTQTEQQALLDAKLIVFQYPYYWYSVPGLLKKWIDEVFAYNFAYGSKGDKLKGKEFLLSFTVGGPEDSYQPLGYNHFAIEQTLHPLQQLSYLTGMNYNKPVYTHSMVYIPDVYNTLESVLEGANTHADRLIASIKQILAK